MTQLRAHRLRTTFRDIVVTILLYLAIVVAMALVGLTHIRVVEW